MSDWLRELARALDAIEWASDSAACANAADEITRLRERVAHLERVQEAADAMRERPSDSWRWAKYDAVRKGEG